MGKQRESGHHQAGPGNQNSELRAHFFSIRVFDLHENLERGFSKLDGLVAVVQLVEGEAASQEGLADGIIAEAARHLARYKLPKEIVFCDRVQRSPSGKADYRWAKAQVVEKV